MYPATQLALDNGLSGLANMIMIGKVIKETQLCTHEHIRETMLKVVPESKKEMFEKNMKAVEIGYQY
jgi:2-oxoglutarate ferredoxin oxidoreductase subunit gamma